MTKRFTERFSEEVKQEIADLYSSEKVHTLTKLAEIYSCSIGTIRNLLIAKRIAIRSKQEAQRRKSNIDEKDKARFWEKVEVGGPEDCWNWTGTYNCKGLGRFGFRGKVLYAHRFAYTLTFGEIPKGMHVYKSCKKNLCVNPAHLILLDRSERAKIPTVLKPKDVLEIRSMVKTGHKQKEIAKKFKISQTTVSKINSRHIWKNI